MALLSCPTCSGVIDTTNTAYHWEQQNIGNAGRTINTPVYHCSCGEYFMPPVQHGIKADARYRI